MFVQKFIYDLASLPKPRDNDVDEEIDRLLYIRTAEIPNYLVPTDGRDQLANLDSEILSLWLAKKFKPFLINLLLCSNENNVMAKQELKQMDQYKTLVDKYLRPSFAERRATKLLEEFFFADSDVPSLQHSITDIKRLLNLLSEHLRTNSPDTMTLFNTDAYTNADITLYNFLKRLVVGNYKNFGLAQHIRLSEPLVKFMRRYATKNLHIIDVSQADPLASSDQEPSLIADIVKPATIGLGLILFYIWSRRK